MTVQLLQMSLLTQLLAFYEIVRLMLNTCVERKSRLKWMVPGVELLLYSVHLSLISHPKTNKQTNL